MAEYAPRSTTVMEKEGSLFREPDPFFEQDKLIRQDAMKITDTVAKKSLGRMPAR